MSSRSQLEPQPSPAAAVDVNTVEASCALEVFTSTTDLLRSLAAQPLWTTAKFSVSQTILVRQALRTCLQSLNLIESALDKRG